MTDDSFVKKCSEQINFLLLSYTIRMETIKLIQVGICMLHTKRHLMAVTIFDNVILDFLEIEWLI